MTLGPRSWGGRAAAGKEEEGAEGQPAPAAQRAHLSVDAAARGEWPLAAVEWRGTAEGVVGEGAAGAAWRALVAGADQIALLYWCGGQPRPQRHLLPFALPSLALVLGERNLHGCPLPCPCHH